MSGLTICTVAWVINPCFYQKNIFSATLKIKPVNNMVDNLVDNLENRFIDPFSKIGGCRERRVLCISIKMDNNCLTVA
jgi:hypothetical protein